MLLRPIGSMQGGRHRFKDAAPLADERGTYTQDEASPMSPLSRLLPYGTPVSDVDLGLPDGLRARNFPDMPVCSVTYPFLF